MRAVGMVGTLIAVWAGLHSPAWAQEAATTEASESQVPELEAAGGDAAAETGSAAPAEAAGAEVVPAPPATSSAPPAPLPLVEPAQAAPPSRVVGVGWALGGGFAAAGAYAFGASAFAIAPAIELPTLEAYFFIDDHLSIDLVLPLWNSIVVSAFAGPAVAANAFLDFSIGDDWVRFLVGPGVGFSHVDFSNVSSTLTVTQMTVSMLVGVELLTVGRLLGFRVMSRPFVGAAFVSGSPAVSVGGGALLEVGLVWYATKS